MTIRILTILFLGLFAQNALAQNGFESAFKRITEQPDYKNASVGVEFTDLKSGELLFGMNGDKRLIPASTMKIVTTATALEILGSDFRFSTTIGYTDSIDTNKRLWGNLVVKSGGDPTLGSAWFAEKNFVVNWVDDIIKAGIDTINGNIIFYDSIFDSDEIPSTWLWGDIGNYYGAGPNAFTVYDNLFSITFKSPNEAGGQTEIIKISPEILGLEIVNNVIASDVNRDLANVFGSPLDKNRVIRGTIPKGKAAFTIKASIPQPGDLLATEFTKTLAIKGVYFTGKVKFQKTGNEIIHPIFINKSPALSEIIRLTNTESINLFAEHILLQIAVAKFGIGSTQKGIEAVNNFWKSKGIDVSDLYMDDGSGLSRTNTFSPSFLNTILLYMHQKSPNSEAFVNSLPAAGKGTLSSFNTDLFPGNTLIAKSGSMSRVRCYSGYLKLDSGKTAAFTIMLNHFSGSQAKLREEIENLLFEIKKSY